MPGQARKRGSEDSLPVVEGEVTPDTLEEMEQSAGREGEEPVIPVEMADDDEEEDEDEDADEDADEEDEDDDEEDEDEDDEDEDDEEDADAGEPEDR